LRHGLRLRGEHTGEDGEEQEASDHDKVGREETTGNADTAVTGRSM
jgi:hypothetical protein